MKISLEKNMNELENYLKDRGYEIVSENSACDAFIYKETPFVKISAKNFSPILTLASNPVLLVNADGKTFSEIEQILTQKTYNKIF